MTRAGRLPVPETVGVGLAHVIAGDGLQLGVDHHDERVDVVAQQVAAPERGAAVDGRRSEVDDEVPDLQSEPEPK